MLPMHALILFGTLGTAYLVTVLVKRRAHGHAAHGARSLATDGRPSVVYFWTPSCVQCRRTQAPIVDEIAGEFGDAIDVRKINAHDEPDAARTFGIFTVPTTVVLDAKGAVHRVNTGLVGRSALRDQIRAAGGVSER